MLVRLGSPSVVVRGSRHPPVRIAQGLGQPLEALGLSEANTKVRLLRARLQLREWLTQALGDPDRRGARTPHDH